MFSLELTDKAIAKIKAFQASETDPTKVFRIYVQGGGCSGFEYGFSFDQATDQDNVSEKDGIKVVVDPYSAPYIEHAVLDYNEDFRGSSFTVSNPNAKSTCGCGQSFSV